MTVLNVTKLFIYILYRKILYQFSAHCGPAVPLTFENGRKGVFGVFIWFMIVPKQNKDLRVTVSVAVNSVWLQAIKSFQLEITV